MYDPNYYLNPKKVRPRRDWVLVLSEPRRETLGSGIIIAPVNETGAEKVTEGTGILIRVGPGYKNDALNLKVGDRVVFRSFLKHANRVETGERWENNEEKYYSLISTDDLMAVVDKNLDVGVFSGRPQNKEKK